ncbi:swarming motility protein SwrC [mine drainage metagenome]|uniref:Swarming motility protein SwrC n=1 Tax=mine drainage metagenome TaxID=410659 RepID=A0A1J5PMN9_9ZZZZ
MVALAGIIMRNSVILVEQIVRLMIKSQHPRRAVIEAAVRRLRPILLTATATILAMIPLMQSTFWRPMAISMMGGAFVATLLTLIFEPAMYAAWFRIRQAEPIQAHVSSDNALLRAAEFGNPETCSTLLRHGGNPDTTDSEDNSALMLAAQNGHIEICTALLAAGANANLAKASGTTALMRAAMNGHDQICRLLLGAGADVNARAGNISALDIAQRRGHTQVAETLMAAGAD